MLNGLRYRVANNLAKKSVELIEKGDFENIKKGMKYFQLSVTIVPPSKELNELAGRLRETAEYYGNVQQRIES